MSHKGVPMAQVQEPTLGEGTKQNSVLFTLPETNIFCT